MKPCRVCWRGGAIGALLVVLVVLSACGPKNDPILQLSAEEAMEMGRSWLEKKKYFKARQHLTRAFEASPNSPLGREALLLVGDTYFLQGGQANLIQAEAKYRDYLNRFPTSQRAAYAQLQIGNALAQRVRKPDRDQSITENAERAYREVIEVYPTSEYAADAREQLAVVRNQLAEHEFTVGMFYIRFGLPQSAIQRFDGLLEDFPEYREKDKIYFFTGVAHNESGQPAEALLLFDKLRREFPESPYLKKIPKLKPPKAAPATPAKPEAPEEPEADSADSVDSGDPS
jgi:outer membrane protein assembly factor BamD